MTSYTEAAFFSSPCAQLLVNPATNALLEVNLKACEMFAQDKARLLAQTVTDLFAACVPQLIVFTEEVIEKGFAWNDKLYIVAPNHDEPLRIEISASTVKIQDQQLVQLSFHDAEVLLRHREQHEAQQRYRSGLEHWNKISKDFQEFERKNQLILAELKEVEIRKRRLELENAYLQEEINSSVNNHMIIGNSQAMRHVVHKIELAAASDIAVLITGEPGTGKELIARAIHESSVRKKHGLIRVNCAALPDVLFNSEFFGQIEGLASTERTGRLELADGGVIFLDEVAEFPLVLQEKLLRVLQQQQFQREGETNAQDVDVRVIAASSKNLAELVEQGKFREDLYFRLNLMRIESCPLRRCAEDIPLLAQHFLQRISKKYNKAGLKIPYSQIEKLQHYSWPGNVRELENVIERQVILAKDDILRFDDLPFAPQEAANIPVQATEFCITENEMKNQQRNNLLNALRQTRGKVFGPGGAAELLDVAPTTLSSRIKKYNIDLRSFK